MSEKPLVANAADEEQVKRGAWKERDQRKQQMEDMRYLLETAQGRRFIWRLLGFCKTFETIWRASAEIHYLAGKQDVGHFVMAEVTEANPNALIQMMTEAKKSEDSKNG